MNRRSGRRRGWIRDALILSGALAAMALAALGFAGMMERGRPTRASLTRDVERALADAVEGSIRLSADVLDDPAVTVFTDALCGRLDSGLAALTGPERDLPDVRVLVVDSDAVNALAFPGDLVVLFSGLVRVMDGPQELAGVLAHELGHCVNEDSRNALIREVGLSVLLATAGGGNAAELAGDVIRGAVRMKYGRRAEKRADAFAVDLLAASGLDPAAYARALESLADTTGETPEWAGYVDVHPPVADRIEAARRRAEGAAETKGFMAQDLPGWEAMRDAMFSPPEPPRVRD